MENNNKVIFIIAVVIVILVTLIAILYTKKVQPQKTEQTNYDIKVYKSHENPDEPSGHSYGECMIDTGDKPLFIAEFNTIVSLGEGSAINSQSINGTYRLDYKGKIIAFDDASGVVYNGNEKTLYYYASPIYEKVMKYCD